MDVATRAALVGETAPLQNLPVLQPKMGCITQAATDKFMVKTDIIPAALYVLENSLDFKTKLIEAIPDLRMSALKLSKGEGRDAVGMITPEFHQTLKILHSNIQTLWEVSQLYPDQVVEYSKKYADSVAEYKNRKPVAAPPSFFDKVKSVSAATVKFAQSGFAATPQDELDKRLALCKGCEWWDPESFGKTGSCKKCGCSTWAKLRMASEKCPIDKWGPVTPSSPEQQPNTN